MTPAEVEPITVTLTRQDSVLLLLLGLGVLFTIGLIVFFIILLRRRGSDEGSENS